MNVIDLLGSIRSLTIKRDTLLNRETDTAASMGVLQLDLPEDKERHQEEEKIVVPPLRAGSGNCVVFSIILPRSI